MDLVETLIELESKCNRLSNPGNAVSEHLRSAVMALVNYELYMDNRPQFSSFEQYMGFRTPEFDPNPACPNPKGHDWNEDHYCSHCGADGCA